VGEGGLFLLNQSRSCQLFLKYCFLVRVVKLISVFCPSKFSNRHIVH